jgi:hypothetical protein
MSRYAYGYSVAPARPTGWRSAVGNFIGMTAVVLLSAISGVVVAYELIGGDARFSSAPASSAAVASAPARVQAPVQAPVKSPAKASAQAGAASSVQPAPAIAAASENQKPVQRAEVPVVATVTASQAAAPAPIAPVAQNEDAAIPASDLTFAKGYALRRAARQAAAAQAASPKAGAAQAASPKAGAAQAASPKAGVAQTATANSKVAAASDEPGAAVEKQFGRPAVVAKRKPNAMAQYPRNERYGMFERFDGPRHQAMAFGDSSPQRPVRRSGGWFDGLF